MSLTPTTHFCKEPGGVSIPVYFQSKILGDYLAQLVSKYNINFAYAGMPSCRSMPLHARACRFIFSQKY